MEPVMKSGNTEDTGTTESVTNAVEITADTTAQQTPEAVTVSEPEAPAAIQGLTDAQVEERVRQGKVNTIQNETNRTVKQIILSNVFSFFNLINVILFAMVLSVGSVKNMLFIFIVTINTLIGIIQEIRAKKALDSLKILTASKAVVLRNGEEKDIAVEEIVVDDCMVLKTGNQIPADGVVLSGQLDVNESLLTGESDTVAKVAEKEVLSGSFVTSGKAVCRVTKVGKDSYMEQISAEAKQFKKHKSQIQVYIDKILQFISIIIVPVGIGLFCKQFLITKSSYENAILDTVAAILGMIPEGLVLLTSIAMAVGTIRLVNRRTLVQEMYCIENLARVDMLCLDKTGTITEGRLCVEDVEQTENCHDIKGIMGRVLGLLNDDNETFKAMKEYFPPIQGAVSKVILPFSSERKFSGVVFDEEGTYLLGAYQFIFAGREDQAVLDKIHEYAAKGLRVLILAHSPNEMSSNYEICDGFEILAFILMTDVIRKEAPKILNYFDEQGVSLKVISGDDPVTVAAIAAKAGLKNADQFVDATTLQTEADIAKAVKTYSVFGRVTPKQKKQMVLALKEDGHVVAMTGDGVNDVLALKQADCSIAMASGSDAAKNTANVVLLDSNFASLPHVVNEGRRVINNVSAAASMFLIKTGFSVLLAILTILMGYAYPFQPVQLSIISGCAVGIPGTLLQLEPSFQKINKNFMQNVLRNAMPAAFTIALTVFLITNIGHALGCSKAMISTVSVLATGWNYMYTLRRVYPLTTTYRKVVIYAMQLAYLGAMVIGQKILDLTGMDFNSVIVTLGAITISPILIDIFEKLYDKMLAWAGNVMVKWKTRKEQNRISKLVEKQQ